MPPVQDLGIAHFLANADFLARGILVILVVMSLLSWYLIISRALLHMLHWKQGEALTRALQGVSTLSALDAQVARHPGNDPLTSLAAAGVEAGRRYETLRAQRGSADSAPAELLVRDVEDAVGGIQTRMDRGLIVLASIGSSAPYVGLLGTVWGVYHALVTIGLSGQGTLDKVAGPVGEALIMTAFGLAVAIPAVLGYNGLVRANRVTSTRLTTLANHIVRTIAAGTPSVSTSVVNSASGSSTPVAAGV